MGASVPVAVPERSASAPSLPLAHSSVHVRALDGVRGLAILLVLLFHFAAMSEQPLDVALDRVVFKIMVSGWIGVDLFFVLSGFLITGILCDSRAWRGQYFRNFYARRFLRIVPAYYLLLALLLLVVPAIPSLDEAAIEGVRAQWPWYAAYLTNVRTVLEPGLLPEAVYTGHLWSLAIEEQFYLVWPAVVLLCNRRALLAVCVFAILSAPAIRVGLHLAEVDPIAAYQLTPARWDALAVGALLALIAREPNALRVALRWARPCAVVSAAALVALSVWYGVLSPYDTLVQELGFSALALFFGAVLLWAFVAKARSPLGWFFGSGVMTGLGRYSYALYLVHLPVASIVAQHLDLAASAPQIGGSWILGTAYVIVVMAAISMLCAFVSWHLWEKQFLKLKTRFRPGAEAAAPAPAVEPVPLPAGPR